MLIHVENHDLVEGEEATLFFSAAMEGEGKVLSSL